MYEWDDNKNAINVEARGIDFAVAEGFDWETAWVVVDGRRDYGEVRYRAMGMIGRRLYVLMYTCRQLNKVRIISLRKANKRELKNYVDQT